MENMLLDESFLHFNDLVVLQQLQAPECFRDCAAEVPLAIIDCRLPEGGIVLLFVIPTFHFCVKKIFDTILFELPNLFLHVGLGEWSGRRGVFCLRVQQGSPHGEL